MRFAAGRFSFTYPRGSPAPQVVAIGGLLAAIANHEQTCAVVRFSSATSVFFGDFVVLIVRFIVARAISIMPQMPRHVSECWIRR
jgi:phage shock protein PspC (stress-responsive transcriptional regulator)